MKILQIINSLGTGGAEKLLLETIPLYHKKGIEMDILLLWDNDCMFTQELLKLNCCNVFILKKSSSIKDIYNPLSIVKIASILKNYNIAHVHLFPAQYFVVFANFLNGFKTKLIFTEHNTTNSRIQSKIFKLFEKLVYKNYSKVVCITKEIRDIYQNYLPNQKSKFQVIENGVAIAKIFNAIPIEKSSIPFNISDSDKIIIQVSAFRVQKDQQTLIKALSHLESNFKLFLVGDGDQKQKCEKLVLDLNLSKRVFFLGQRNDIPSLLNTADFVVLSSFYEGLSLASIEGLASGKPFIASNVPGLSDIVNGYGVLFEQGNVEELANIIRNLNENEEEYKQVSKRCIARAKEFDISKMVSKHIDLYKELYAKA